MDEAILWTKRFLEVLGEGECELRPIFDPTDFPKSFRRNRRRAKGRGVRIWIRS
jgi:hypothetical protein